MLLKGLKSFQFLWYTYKILVYPPSKNKSEMKSRIKEYFLDPHVPAILLCNDNFFILLFRFDGTKER